MKLFMDINYFIVTDPNDVRILFESLPTGGHVHDLPPDAGLGVLPDGRLPPPPGQQGGAQIIVLRGVISLALAGCRSLIKIGFILKVWRDPTEWRQGLVWQRIILILDWLRRYMLSIPPARSD